MVSSVMKSHLLKPENTRLRKIVDKGKDAYHIFQASADADDGFELKRAVYRTSEWCKETIPRNYARFASSWSRPRSTQPTTDKPGFLKITSEAFEREAFKSSASPKRRGWTTEPHPLKI